MSISAPPPASLPQRPLPSIPPLENGDHLDRQEFERRYVAMPGLKKAELIEGVVHLPSPVRHDVHGNPHADLVTWLGMYRSSTAGVTVGDNSTVRIDPDNVLQPDALLKIERARGGQSQIDADGYIAGAPELVVEVAATSASIDLNTKLNVYRRSNGREYVVWRTLDRAIDWFILRQRQFEPLLPAADGLIRSETFPGLWLDPAALLAGDLATVLKRLQQGLATNEHATFVARLQGNSYSG